MKIIVLIKQVPDTWVPRTVDPDTGILDRDSSDAVMDEINERALEIALSYKDANSAEVVVLTMGPSEAKDALRKAMAMGADSALHVLDDSLSGADMVFTSAVLAAAITFAGFDLVISGNESTDGAGGVVPAMVAEHLGVPHLTYLDAAAISASSVSGVRTAERGNVTVGAPLPAVISVTERSASPRFPNFRGIMKAKKKPLTVLELSDLAGFAPVANSRRSLSAVVAVNKRPPRQGGIKVVDDGSAANQLAEFLKTRNLI